MFLVLAREAKPSLSQQPLDGEIRRRASRKDDKKLTPRE
jgi:hypothetical protein